MPWLHSSVESEGKLRVKQEKKSYFVNASAWQWDFAHTKLWVISMPELPLRSHMLIALLKGTSTAYLQPADSVPTFTRFMYYPLDKRVPEWGVALCNESFSWVMKLVWNKESGSNIKLCPITIITDLSIGWEGGHSLSRDPIPTYRLDNNLELMPGIMVAAGEGGREKVAGAAERCRGSGANIFVCVHFNDINSI